MKKKRLAVPVLAIVSAFILIAAFLYLKCATDGNSAKHFYFENKEKLNAIENYFAVLYEPSLHKIRYDMQRHEYTKVFEDREEYASCTDDICSELDDIYSSYGARSDYGGFSVIVVNYDQAGKMLLVVSVKDSVLRNDSVPDQRYRRCVLIYKDEDYAGPSFLEFDGAERNEISGNWYYWSYNAYTG